MIDEWGATEPPDHEPPMPDPIEEPPLDTPLPSDRLSPGAMAAAVLGHPELLAALADREAASSRLDTARDALADAEGIARVAAAKRDDFEGDETKAAWQLLAATEAIEKAERTIERRRTTVTKAEHDLDAATRTVAALNEAITAGPEPEPEPAPAKPFYDDVGQFVAGFLAPIWRHRIDPDGRTVTWCAQWWRHPEAVARLEALWRGWEKLRLDPSTGMSVWFRDHGDHHMAVLTSVDGPLGGCTTTMHKPKFARLPIDPPDPPDMFAIDGQEHT